MYAHILHIGCTLLAKLALSSIRESGCLMHEQNFKSDPTGAVKSPPADNSPVGSGKIFQLIPKIMAEVGSIGKDRKNLQQNYAFRGIDDVYNALKGPLSKNGVFIAPEVMSQLREERQTKNGGNLIYTVLTMKFVFYADDGSSFNVVTIGEAMDSGDKSANKAMSAALKYAFLQVFCIATEGDNDTENGSPEVKPKINPEPKPDFRSPIQPQNTPHFGLGNGQIYKVDFSKKYMGKTLQEIGEENCISFKNYLLDSVETSGKPLGDKAKEFIRQLDVAMNLDLP